LGVDKATTHEIARNSAVDYMRAIQFKTSSPERTLLFHYDSVFDGSCGQKLSAFCSDIKCNPDNIWKSKFVKDVQDVKTPWVTGKYGKMIEKVSRSEPDLDNERREVVKSVTFDTYEKAVALA
jgi:hypothetical protein